MNGVSQRAEPCASFEEQFPPPPTSRDLDQLQHHISLKQLGERLQKAANAAFPNDNRMRYTSVYVLLLFWHDEDPNLPVSLEAFDLKEVFENVYHFNVETWEIPSDGSHKRVNQKILDFVELGGDSKDDLKIIFYGGHGMLGSSRQSCWASRPNAQDPSFRTVKWSGIQHVLEEAESDVLLLFDCCSSGTANTDVGNGVTELIGACGFNASANPVGPDSFTRALITELRLLSTRSAFTVGVLYNKILCRVQNWMPEGREMQKPPLHVVLTQNCRLPRSIQLSASRGNGPSREQASEPVASSQSSTKLSPETPEKTAKRRRTRSAAPSAPSSKRRRTRNSSPKYLHSPDSSLSSQESITGTVFEPSSSISSASSLSSVEDLGPKIALTIRLKESLAISEASSNLFSDWMKMMPLLAEHVKVEASFSSFSTLLMLSLTVPLWCYLENHPAISLTGLIRSSNQLARAPVLAKTLCPGTIQSNCDLTTSLKPTPRTLNWGEHAEALIQLYKFNFAEDEAYFELSRYAKPTATIPRRVYLENFIGRNAPYKCLVCQSEGQSILDGPESLAMHYIACHSVSEPKTSTSNVSKQFSDSLASSKSQNQQLPQASCLVEARVEGSAPLGVCSTSVASVDDQVGQSISSKMDGVKRNAQVNEGDVSPSVRPNSLHGSDPALPDLPPEAVSESTRSENAVESYTTSVMGEEETLKDTQRNHNADEMGPNGGARGGQTGGGNHHLQDYHIQLMLLEQQNKKRLMMARGETDSIYDEDLVDEHMPVQAESNNVNRFPARHSPTIKKTAAPPEKIPHHQDDSSRNMGENELRRDIDASASVSSTCIPHVSYIPSWATATSQPSVMERYYLNGSIASTFSTVLDSAYASYDSYDPGYCSQLLEPPEDSTGTVSTRPTPVTLGWMPDTYILKMYTFLAPKGHQPYFQLRQEYKETPETPQRVYLDSNQNPKKNKNPSQLPDTGPSKSAPYKRSTNEYPCQFPSPSCSERAPFKRPADLERHYQNVHVSAEAKDQWPCDYSRCPRHLTPFTRKDYLRNHLKEYHKEDLGRAQGHRTLTKKAWSTIQKDWLDERQINAKWWRCSKCLSRIHIATDGFECRLCKLNCEEDRRGRIEALNVPNVPSGGYSLDPTSCRACSVCNGTALMWDIDKLGWSACDCAVNDEDIDEGLGC